MDRDQIISVIKRTFAVVEMPSEVTQEAIGAWDSLGHLRLMIEIEKEFGIKFKMQDMPTLTTLERIQECVNKAKMSE